MTIITGVLGIVPKKLIKGMEKWEPVEEMKPFK